MSGNIMNNDILAMVAHDLRSPLSCIEGYATTLQSIPLEAHQREEALARILSCTRWAATLVSDLMDTMAIESGNFSLERRVVTLEDILDEAVDSFEFACKVKNVKISLIRSKDPLLVLADSVRIRQVLHNLLNNAVKHVQSGGEIRAGAYHFGDYAVVEVTDTGSGISAEDQQLVFNKFFKKGVTKGSLGLGLFIAREIIEAHAGFIGVRSDGIGQGSTFHFSLPIFNPERTYAEFKKRKASDTPIPVKLLKPASNIAIQALE